MTNYFLILPVTLVLYTFTYKVFANVDCITTKSAISTNIDDARTFAECPSSHSTLVSCGGETANALGVVFDGTHIDSTAVPTRCYSNNGKDSSGVYAYARCCNFIPNDITCEYFSSVAYSSNADDAYITTACGTIYNIMLGCTVHTPWGKLDGSFVGSSAVRPDTKSQFDTYNYAAYNECTAQNGVKGGGVKANLACCKSDTYSLTCLTRYGSPAHPLSTVSCPAGYFMAGCSAWGFHLPNGWWINNANDRCYARSPEAEDVYAVATCCKLQTDSPTTDPTQSPITLSPSYHPTESPIYDPTNMPTISPNDMEQTVSQAPIEKQHGDNININSNMIVGVIAALVFLFLCLCCLGLFFVWYCLKKKKNLNDGVNEVVNDGKSPDIMVEGVDGTRTGTGRMTSNATLEQKDNILPCID